MPEIATSVVIHRPVAVVYAFFTRPEQIWGARPQPLARDPPGPVAVGTHLRGHADSPNGPVDTDLTVVDLQPNARLVLRDCSPGRRPTEFVYTFTSLPEGTRVDYAQEFALPTVREVTPDLGDPAMTTIAQAFGSFFIDQVSKTIAAAIARGLQEDKRRLEAEAPE